MIYDYLFYKGYQIGKWSKNFDDMPALAGIIWVAFCFMLNIFTVTILFEAWGLSSSFSFESKYKYIFSLALVLLLIFYYTYNGRYKKIVERYEDKERNKGNSLHPIIVILTYLIISFGLGTIAAMYKNGDGIFK